MPQGPHLTTTSSENAATPSIQNQAFNPAGDRSKPAQIIEHTVQIIGADSTSLEQSNCPQDYRCAIPLD